MINWDELVESSINKIHFDVSTKEVQIEVRCIWGDKKNMRIIARGINEFVINNTKLSNIIDRINIFESVNAEENKEEILGNLFFLMRGVMPSSSDLEWPLLKEKFIQICSGDFSLMEVEPVYGAKALILANEFMLEDV